MIGEILVGTPIPAIVPLPGQAMPPLPGNVSVVVKDANGDGTPDSSQAKVDRTDIVASGPLAGELRNPGYPFWIGGIEDIVGQRAPTPPLDMYAPAGGWDGGLPRHAVDGYLAGGASENIQTRLDLTKKELVAKPVYFPEQGTAVERAAMAFHAQRCHDTALPDGTAAVCDTLNLNDSGQPNSGGFVTNGAPPVPGAPFQEPCIDDEGDLVKTGGFGDFYVSDGLQQMGPVQFGAEAPRVYKGAVIQTDVTFNKVGYHYPQQRIITLWDRGLGVIFTHDHYGPSTHQQIGLYATVLTEPAGSTWVHNESGEQFYTRPDGGPTSWQAAILTGDTDGDGTDDSFREFYFEYSDFQHAYEKGVY